MFYEVQHFGVTESFRKETGENFNFPIHLHQAFELVVLLGGEMDITIDSAVYHLKEGEAVLIFPNQLHSLSSSRSRHMLCIFSSELIAAYSNKVSQKIPKDNRFTMDPYWLKIFAELDSSSSTFAKKGFLYSICAAFDKQAVYEKRISDARNLLYQIFEFVDEHYDSECTLEDLSEQTGYSYTYMSRYFKKTVGLSFNTFVNQYRIGKACYLLTNTEQTILDCAYTSGYKSLRSFNRNFKELLHITPQEYRSNASADQRGE